MTKDFGLKQQQAELAVSPIGSIVNGSSNGCVKEPVVCPDDSGESIMISNQASLTPSSETKSETMVQDWSKPNRCSTSSRKRVGLTGFNCKCGKVFCAAHRYSEKQIADITTAPLGKMLLQKPTQ